MILPVNSIGGGSTKMGVSSRVGVLVERQRAYGRRFCEGAASFACECPEISLGMLEWSSLNDSRSLSRYDAFIVRVLDDQMEQILQRTHKPVVDVFYGKRREGFAVADLDNVAIGNLAAEHFISRGFREFAYCGYDGINFSDVRQATFARAVEQSGYVCHVFAPRKRDAVYFNENVVKGERYTPPANEAGAMRSWLRRLPKPVAVFCSHDLRAYQVLTLCRDAGIPVPNEVAILGVDDDAILCGFTTPTLSSIDPNGFETGREAVRIVREMLCNHEARSSPPCSLVKPRRLIVRGSSEVYPLASPWLSDALVYINRNASKGITAADVFAHVGLSHTTVGAAFRQKVGMSVQDMLAKVRIEEACRLLESGMSVTDVARKSGFSSVQYFCRAFATEHGMSPAVWRTVKH